MGTQALLSSRNERLGLEICSYYRTHIGRRGNILSTVCFYRLKCLKRVIGNKDKVALKEMLEGTKKKNKTFKLSNKIKQRQ